MRIFAASILLLFFVAGLVQGVDYEKKKHSDHNTGFGILENVSVDIEGSTLILTDERTDDYVEISEDFELFVNGELIPVSKDEKLLLEKYYHLYFDIIDYAKRIGLEGAKIGVEGAAIGVKAVAGVFKLLREDYDSEDLEAELEEEADKLEEKAEQLEDRAKNIEDMAEVLENLHYQLGDEIEALSDLEMFE